MTHFMTVWFLSGMLFQLIIILALREPYQIRTLRQAVAYSWVPLLNTGLLIYVLGLMIFTPWRKN